MTIKDFAQELRKWWSFDDHQQHTHSWHSREDFIEKKLPSLLATMRNKTIEECAQAAMQDTMGPVGNDCCMETRDAIEQATVDAIRKLKL